MTQQNEHQAFFNAKAAYEESPTPATQKKLFNAMLPYLKDASSRCDYEYFIRTLSEMDNYGFLEMSSAANQIVWTVIGLLNRLKSNTQFPIEFFEIFFSLLAKLNYNRPSLEHSLVMKFFLKRTDHYEIFEQFINWWEIKNLRDEDYRPEQFKETLFPPLAETLYVELSKSILVNAENSLPLGHVEKNYLLTLAKELDAIYLKHPQFKFFPYYSAKLQLTAGFTKGALETVLPFVRHNISQFWVWELLADFFRNDAGLRIAILCRAMICKAEEHMKTGLQTKLFEAFLESKMYDEAHEELDKIIQILEFRKWKISPALLANKDKEWYLESVNRYSAFRTHQKYAREADGILFNDQPAKMAVITAFLPDRGVAFIVTEDLINSKFKTSKFYIQNPEPGLLLQVITESVVGNIEVLQAKPANIQFHDKLFQEVEGRIKLMSNKIFGILNGVYVPQELIEQTRVQDGYPVTAKAIRSYDKKKDVWGWKAISLKINFD